MISPPRHPAPHNHFDDLEDLARSLNAIAGQAEGLSKDASEALARAATDLTHAAQSLRQHASATARSVADRAVHEIREHPIASLAAAITAASALIRVFAAARGTDK